MKIWERLIKKSNKNTTQLIPSLLYIYVKLNGQFVYALIDTGSQLSIISKNLAKKCKLARTIDTNYIIKISCITNTFNTYGKIWLAQINVHTYDIPCTFIVVDNSNIDLILGLDFILNNNCKINFNKKVLNVGDICSLDLIKKN